MIRSVVFHEKAEKELIEAAAWYESKAHGLGRLFLNDAEHAVSRISEFPDSSPIILDRVRCRSFTTFPYSILYSVVKDTIRILAIAHQKRQPLYWKNR